MSVMLVNLVVLIIVIFATTGEVEALLPVIGMLLQFSPEEVKFSVCIRCSIFIGYSDLSHGLYFILHNEISHGKLPLNIVYMLI